LEGYRELGVDVAGLIEVKRHFLLAVQDGEQRHASQYLAAEDAQLYQAEFEDF
jgi:hypothetical protein